MAIMIPQKLSRQTKSNAEKKLFEIFKKDLSNDYTVFHGVWWQHIKYIVQDREADFIIIHPDKGILILEAKGGEIKYDPVNKYWYQNDKIMKISPFQQAKEIKFKFLDFLTKIPEFSKKDFCIGHCVSFPDIDYYFNNLPSESPPEILLLRPDLQDINNWVSSVFNYYKAGQVKVNLRNNRIEKIINIISPSTTFKKYLVNDLGEIQEEILKLTEQQFNILNNLCLQSQSIILGCAGSGKTQLAIEKTKRLCQHKIKTLVTCKSLNLALYITHSLKDEIEEEFCKIYSYEEIKVNNFKIDFNCEAIIVDEGQDFEREEIEQLKKLIQNNGIFYIFQDSNQNISKNTNKFALQVNPTVLNKNCRNTHKIFEYSKPFISCVHQIKSSSIQGRDVIKREYRETTEIRTILENDIINLVEQENVLPHQIIVLTDIHPLSKSILCSYPQINRFNFKQYSLSKSNKNKDTIQWLNIGMYKGLESDVVILFFEKPKTLIPSNWDIANKYIGATRAKSLLIIYETPDPEIDV